MSTHCLSPIVPALYMSPLNNGVAGKHELSVMVTQLAIERTLIVCTMIVSNLCRMATMHYIWLQRTAMNI